MAFSLKAHSTTDGWKDFLGGELLNLGLNGLNIVISYEDACIKCVQTGGNYGKRHPAH
jgi:hypothetical protein